MLYYTNVGDKEHEVVVDYQIDVDPADPSVGYLEDAHYIVQFDVLKFNDFRRQNSSLENWKELDRIVESLIDPQELIEHWQDVCEADREYALELRYEDRRENVLA